MIDGGLRQLFHKRREFYDFHWQAIETGCVGSGVPDSNYCCHASFSPLGKGIEGWIEFKKISRGHIVSVRKEQVAWIEKGLRFGRRIHIAVRDIRDVHEDVLLIYPGSSIRALKTGRFLDASPALITGGGPSRWDWSAVRALLVE